MKISKQRTILVAVRFSEQEIQQIEQIMKDNKFTNRSKYIRTAALYPNRITEIYEDMFNKEALEELKKLINRFWKK